MSPKTIPDRWEDYNPIGKKVEGTRFIPFKVPLREYVSVAVESAKRLDDKILLHRIPNLGLIIDLTNTYRYYDPMTFANKGIQYEKIMIPGKETPSKQFLAHFIKIVKNFVNSNKNNDKLIGVHCTHGVNRTGYLICYYMISQMTMEPKEAMDKFKNARGYEIERINYIQSLENLKLGNEQISRERSRKRERWEEYQKNCNRDVKRSNDNSRGDSSTYTNWRERSPHSRSRDNTRSGSNKYENWRERQINYNRDVSVSRNNSRDGSRTYENWRARVPHVSYQR